MDRKSHDAQEGITITPHCVVFPSRDSRSVLAGIYFPNGVMQENAENLGISYAVDGLLYEMLSDLNFKVSAHTFYGYSEFLLFLPWEKAATALKDAMNILLSPHFSPELLADWQAYQATQVKKRDGFDAAYYPARFPNSRFAKPIPGSAKDTQAHTIVGLAHWHHQFYTEAHLYACITGCVTHELIQQMMPLFSQNDIPSSPSQKQWAPATPGQAVLCPAPHRGKLDLVVAYPVEVEPAEIWNWEGVCCAIRTKLEPVLSSVGGVLLGPLLVLDSPPELRIHVQCLAKYAPALSRQIVTAIRHSIEHIDQTEFERIRQNLMEAYGALSRDPVEWNRFLGWNAIMGPWYDPKSIWHSDAFLGSVTLEGMQHILFQLSQSIEPMFFIHTT